MSKEKNILSDALEEARDSFDLEISNRLKEICGKLVNNSVEENLTDDNAIVRQMTIEKLKQDKQ